MIQDSERVSPRCGCKVGEQNFGDCARASEKSVGGEVPCSPGEEGDSGVKRQRTKRMESPLKCFRAVYLTPGPERGGAVRCDQVAIRGTPMKRVQAFQIRRGPLVSRRNR